MGDSPKVQFILKFLRTDIQRAMKLTSSVVFINRIEEYWRPFEEVFLGLLKDQKILGLVLDFKDF